MVGELNIAWDDLSFDTLASAELAQQDVLRAVRPARSLLPAATRSAALSVADPASGELLGALGASFYPDQAGQLVVAVVVSGDEMPPEEDGAQVALPRALAVQVLEGTLETAESAALGAGVLRFDRAVVVPGSAGAALYRWLAASVVRLLVPDLASLPEEELAALLEVSYPVDAPPTAPYTLTAQPRTFGEGAWGDLGVPRLIRKRHPHPAAEPLTDDERQQIDDALAETGLEGDAPSDG